MARYYRAPGSLRNPRTGPTYDQLVETIQQLKYQHDRALEALQSSEKTNQQLERELSEVQKLAAELRHELQATREAVNKSQVEDNEQDMDAAAADETEWREQYLRLQADMENYKKRLEQRSNQDVQHARHQILGDMLSLADHLELAINHLEQEEGVDSTPHRQIYLTNLQATLHSFQETLRRHGVTRIEAENQPFDPQFHEAVGQIDSESVPVDQVVEVIQTGYLEDSTLLRPARVLVSRGPSAHDTVPAKQSS